MVTDKHTWISIVVAVSTIQAAVPVVAEDKGRLPEIGFRKAIERASYIGAFDYNEHFRIRKTGPAASISIDIDQTNSDLSALTPILRLTKSSKTWREQKFYKDKPSSHSRDVGKAILAVADYLSERNGDLYPWMTSSVWVVKPLGKDYFVYVGSTEPVSGSFVSYDVSSAFKVTREYGSL